MTTTTDTDPTSQPPPPPPFVRPRLERSTDDRYVAGVCGGLGRYFDIDPVIVRVIVGCMAIFGAGLLLYAFAWAFVPEAGREASIAQAARHTRAPGKELAIIAIVVVAGLIALDGVFGNGGSDGGWIIPLLIIAAAVWWHRGDRRRAGAAHGHYPWPGEPGGSTPSAPATPPAPSAFWAGTATAPPAGTPTVPLGAPHQGTAWGYAAQQWEPRPPKQRSRLGFLTFSALLVGLGIALLLDAADVVDLSAQSVLATALVIVGAGLVLGAWVGRSRGLIALGLLLTVAVSAVSALDLPTRGEAGDRSWVLTSTDQLRADNDFGISAGSGRLDLSAIEFGDQPVAIAVSVGLGEMEVIVPDAAVVRVFGHVGLGELHLFDRVRDGMDVDLDMSEPGTPNLVIHARVGLGEMRVRNATS